jgi:hypothetical protein
LFVVVVVVVVVVVRNRFEENLGSPRYSTRFFVVMEILGDDERYFVFSVELSSLLSFEDIFSVLFSFSEEDCVSDCLSSIAF